MRESQGASPGLPYPAPEGNVELLAPKTDRYICQNPSCRNEFERPKDSGPEGNTNPRCTCGSEMKKVYSKPMARKLSKSEARALRKKAELPGRSRS
jgi:hypothetical protein